MAIAARICPNDVRLTLEQAIPGGMSLEDYSLMREVIAAIREGLPEADQLQPGQVFQHVLEALRDCSNNTLLSDQFDCSGYILEYLEVDLCMLNRQNIRFPNSALFRSFMTDEEEFAARSQLKWKRDGDAWILLYSRRRMGRVVPDKDHSGMWRSVKVDGILATRPICPGPKIT